MVQDSNHLIWIDLEMTGLDTVEDTIIEIATVITDNNLTVLAEGPVIAIYQHDSVLARMDDWNQKHHGSSGLIERIRQSVIDMGQAEQQTIEFLEQWVPASCSPMCGNSICQDRRFMARLMPKLETYFHYRNLDVSTLKELAKRWKPAAEVSFKKKAAHRALDDIIESIEELRHYRQHFIQA